jgi:hypothetical protein
MHSSIARALVKGKVRGAKTNLCKFKDVLDNSVPLSGKKIRCVFSSGIVTRLSNYL